MTLKPGDAWKQAFGGSSVSYQQQPSTTDSLVGCLIVIVFVFGGFYFYLDRFVADHSGEKVAQSQKLVQPVQDKGDIPLQLKDLDKAQTILQEVPAKSKHYASAQLLLATIGKNRNKLKLLKANQLVARAASGLLAVDETGAALAQAKNDLSHLPADKEVQNLNTQIKKLEVAMQKSQAAQAALDRKREKAAEVTTRSEYAKQYERNLLEAGMDVYVSTSGPQHTTLRIQYVLLSRPVVYQIINDRALMRNWRELGFKKALFTDGYNETYTVDVPNS
jgi:hypothetical protein